MRTERVRSRKEQPPLQGRYEEMAVALALFVQRRLGFRPRRLR